MMGRRGILLNNALALLIAAIGLSILFFAAYKLYEVNVNQGDEQAKNVINVVEARIESLEEGETGEFLVRGVENWFLAGWGSGEESPDKCLFKSCICICEGDFSDYSTVEGENVICQTSGFCRQFDVEKLEVKMNQELHHILNGEVIKVGYMNKDFIPFKTTQLLSLDVNKEEDSIFVVNNADPLELEDVPLES